MSFSSLWGGNTGRAIRRESAKLAIVSIWFVVIYYVVIAVLHIVLANVLPSEDIGEQIMDDSSRSLHHSWPWFILVYGICAPLYLKNMLSFGLTRGQFATGLIWASALVTAGYVALDAIISAVTGQFAAANLLSDFLIAFSFWLFGWIVAVGFQYRNVFTSAGGIALAVFLIYALIRYAYVEQALGSWNVETYFFEFSAPGAAMLAAADALLAAVLHFLTRRISVRC
ncbi:MAG: hypothetical protein LBJ91_04565 [Clostridiales Family XIII bacterium]|jgi:hypothetical protein|nr:hypothetical protein [Clostridiales Family XIII bacterium]